MIRAFSGTAGSLQGFSERGGGAGGDGAAALIDNFFFYQFIRRFSSAMSIFSERSAGARQYQSILKFCLALPPALW
jgi:hypothetical protein